MRPEANRNPYMPPPPGRMWLVPTDMPLDDDLVRVALDNAFPGLPESMELDEAERRIRAALAAALPLYERKLRERIGQEIQLPHPYGLPNGPTLMPSGHLDELLPEADEFGERNERTAAAAKRLHEIVERRP